mgnify:CR=1 FL=1
MSCSSTGLSLGMASCISNYGDPKMFGISSIKKTYASIGAAQSIESVKAAIEEDATMIVTKDINGVESTNVEAVTEDNSFGTTNFLRNTPGNDVIYLKSNPADFNGFVGGFKGGTYYVEPYLSGNVKLLHKNADGTLQGFKGQLVASPVGMPAFDGKNQQYRLNCYWDNAADWENVVLVPLVDDLSDYVDLMPVGWEADYTTAYAATNQSIKVWERGDITALMSQTPVVRVIGSNVDTPAISAGAPALGVSILTATKAASPVTLAAGDYIQFMWMTSSVDVTLQFYGAGSPPPASPSIIITVTKV